MPLPFRPACQPTSLGPLPHTDPNAAWDLIQRYTPGLPALPLLANEGEALTLLGADGFAGVSVNNVEARLDRAAVAQGLTPLYAAYLRGTTSGQAIDLAALPQLQPSEQVKFRRSRMLFGLVLGPVSLALSLIDEGAEPVLNDAELLDALAKHVFLRRRWLVQMLERIGKPVAVWVYEPYLNAILSPFSPLPASELLNAVDQVISYGMLRALWLPDVATLVALDDTLPLDLLGLPLPPLSEAAAAGPILMRCLAAKTTLAWGIVPVTSEGLRGATVGRLAARFEAWLRALETVGLPPTDVVAASLIMPEDTLAYLEPVEAERSLALTTELASLIRQSYGVE